MGLECADGPFSHISSVDVRGYQLVFGFPFTSDSLFVGCTGLIVEDLEVNSMALGMESLHDRVVGLNAMSIFAVLEGGMKDGIGVAVVGNHNVLIATAYPDGKAATVICVKLADGLYNDVHFSCFDLG